MAICTECGLEHHAPIFAEVIDPAEDLNVVKEKAVKTINETVTGIRDIEVTFSSDTTDPVTTHTRMVNVCFEADGTTYDSAATDVRIGEVGAGVEHKIAVGVIS